MDSARAAGIIAAFEKAMESVANVMEKLMDAAEEIEKFLAQGPLWLIRKQDRERAQSIERAYRTEITRIERERPFRRVYKPP